jgi:predicted alpha/beta superfamily hydrolase
MVPPIRPSVRRTPLHPTLPAWVTALLWLLLAACGDAPAPGAPAPDAGGRPLPVDAGDNARPPAGDDAGPAPGDTQDEPADAGDEDDGVRADAEVQADSTLPPTDAALPSPDDATPDGARDPADATPDALPAPDETADVGVDSALPPTDAVEDADPADAGTADVVLPVDAGEPGDTGPVPVTLEGVLGALDTDLDGTLRRIHHDQGWPLQLENGAWLLVWTDTTLTHAGGVFDGWTGTPSQLRTGYRWLTLGADAQGGYKFTDRTRWVADPWARSLTWDEFGEMSLLQAPPPRLDRWRDMETPGLPSRTVWVWVPAPPITHTLYMHDGRNLFAPSAPFGGWRMQERAPAGMMVVGIDHSSRRMDEYTHVQDRVGGSLVGGDADRYLDWLVDTLRPWVRGRWGEPGAVGILGSSLGGLVSLYATVRHPDAWDWAGSMSGTVGWGRMGHNAVTIIERMQDPAWTSTTPLYVDSGGGATACRDTDGDGIRNNNENASDNYCENLQLRDVLAARGRTFEVNLWHWHEPGAPHSEAAWSARVFRPLAAFASVAR